MSDTPLAAKYRRDNLFPELFTLFAQGNRPLLKSIWPVPLGALITQYESVPVLHHIWERRGPNSDCWSNFIMVSQPIHDWFHKEPILGHILCSWYKYDKQRQNQRKLSRTRPNEFDLGELHGAAGFLIPGWMDTDKVKNRTAEEPWFEKMRHDLAEATGNVD